MAEDLKQPHVILSEIAIENKATIIKHNFLNKDKNREKIIFLNTLHIAETFPLLKINKTKWEDNSSNLLQNQCEISVNYLP